MSLMGLPTLTLAAAYRPFFSPMPIWDYWWALLFPLVIGVSVVYKAIKCRTVGEVPREAATITFWILVGLGATGVGLSVIVKLLER